MIIDWRCGRRYLYSHITRPEEDIRIDVDGNRKDPPVHSKLLSCKTKNSGAIGERGRVLGNKKAEGGMVKGEEF